MKLILALHYISLNATFAVAGTTAATNQNHLSRNCRILKCLEAEIAEDKDKIVVLPLWVTCSISNIRDLVLVFDMVRLETNTYNAYEIILKSTAQF
ncbi:hypothetical protein K0M31_010303 [Melipona bicolor]|uniref:Secreted protein n=1 Tax=Melipona bicolor TaxID=60889 RepID=A0AA40FM92_9HYME|nr:hypothetical protein K0M31_010303 [Melipona bicolor]